MRYRVILSCFFTACLFVTNIVKAQWKHIASPVVNVPIAVNSVVTKGDTTLVGTYRGTIYRTTDGGNSWITMNNGLSRSLYETFSLMAVSDTVYAGTTDGVYVSEDWGKNWMLMNNGLPSGENIVSLANSGNTVYAATSDNGVYHTTDSGNNWLPDTIGLPRSVYNVVVPVNSIIVDDTVIFAGTNLGIYRKNLSGISWKAVNTQIYVYNLTADSNRVFAAAGSCSGSVYFSNDLGNTWQNISAGLPQNSSGCYGEDYSIAVLGKEILANINYSIYSSFDNGRHWAPINSGFKRLYETYLFAPRIITYNNQLIAATFEGLYKLKAGDTTWTLAFNKFPIIPSFINCFSLGNKLILKTDANYFNGTIPGTYISTVEGENWSPDTISLIKDFHNFITVGNMVFGIGNGMFLSTDSGASWTERDSGLPKFGGINDIVGEGTYLFAAYGAYMLNGDVGGIYQSENNGNIWSLSGLDGKPVRSLAIADGSVLAQGTGFYSPNFLFRTSNYGKKWIKIDSLLPAGILPFKITNAGGFLFLATNHGVYSSTNDGNTWLNTSEGLPKDSSDSYVPISYLYVNKVVPALRELLFTKIQNRVFVLSAGSNSWKEIESGLLENGNNISFLTADNNNIFAFTNNGIWRIKLSGIDTINSVVNIKIRPIFRLMQNYPNPFNPSTTIKYQLPSNSFVTLIVYDVLGRKLKTLVNEKENAGIHSITLNAANLSRGVNIYRLKAGKYASTKKALLMK